MSPFVLLSLSSYLNTWSIYNDFLLIFQDDYKVSNLSPKTFRVPAPGEQPQFETPKTEASAISNNSYFKRDTRRNYPRLAVYNQSDVAKLISNLSPVGFAEPEAAPSETAQPAVQESTQVAPVKSLNETILSLKTPIYSIDKLPPTPGTAYVYSISTEQDVQDPGQYYPTYKVC
ncbi:hypothetical protein AYI68_g3428 [Smittium mucronatum]|uniref:Uncharacterized protein n=1 Tax=Smittium mucronatum TaxID=133383 RepID=A0A1R0GZX1_9FUNG|nr:hypothetical protein AYI68_g3428 [Smittium mucronatum]